MQFHHHGYVSGDPRVQDAAGTGIDRPAALPDEVDVLIVGSGPAGMLLAAQMSQYPDITTRIIEKREGRLVLGQADGIQPRSVETFQAFGFAERIIAEAYNIGWMNFWGPDPEHPDQIVRTTRTADYAYDICEFPHLIVNQARVLDYFAEAAADGPGRIVPDYGVEFLGLTVHEEGEYPVEVHVRHVGDAEERVVRAKYVVGCDGARSGVRQAIGRTHVGASAAHAWGVMDVLVNTDFPDWRTKCAINSRPATSCTSAGGRLPQPHVHRSRRGRRGRRPPRAPDAHRGDHPARQRDPPPLHARCEAGGLAQRLRSGPPCDGRLRRRRPRRRSQPAGLPHRRRLPHAQRQGRPGHERVDAGWLQSRLEARFRAERPCPEALLATYGAERRPVAQQLIDFDREWSSLMARKPEEISDPNELATYYLATAEFPSGFMTQYTSSMITGTDAHQELAVGYPLGKRFKSAEVVRVGDGNVVHLGHHAKADGRWRVYAFGDRTGRRSPRGRRRRRRCSRGSPRLTLTPTPCST